MQNQDFYTTVKIKLLERGEKMSELRTRLNISNSYNWFYQVLKGQRTSPETIEQVKTYLKIK